MHHHLLTQNAGCVGDDAKVQDSSAETILPEAESSERTTVNAYLIGIALSISLATLLSIVALTAFSGPPQTIMLAGAAFISVLTSLVLLFRPLAAAGLEERIEMLEDLRWQARDSADHLQALLDGQSDLIVERDHDGRITFANRSFCRKFDITPASALGRPFHPTVIEHEIAGPSKKIGNLPDWAEAEVEQIRTPSGPRWIEWTHRRLPGTDGRDVSIQTSGRDITEQRRHENALASARDKARAADRVKTRFLASMSHEIRTPMNGILGMAALLAETKQTPEQQTYTEAVRTSAGTLLNLIDEILDFSRIEAGHLELSETPFDVVENVRSVVELLAPRAHQKSLQLVWSVAPDMPRALVGDEARFRQVLLNLIGNAVKFTEEGGVTIWVGAQQLAGDREQRDFEVKVVVRDTGPGLGDEASSRVFLEFERAATDGSAPHESGTGLGLAISRRLAIGMGGGIKVASKPGQGATFTLTVQLPLARPQLTEPRDAIMSERNVVIVSPKKIERAALADFLRAHDVVVTELTAAEDFARFAEAENRSALDLVLIDDSFASSVTEGSPVAKACLSAERAGIIANAGNRAAIQRSRQVGIANYLIRPVRPSTLLALLAGSLDRHGAEQLSHDVAKPEGDQQQEPMLGRRVLVAEDNQINALLARTVLNRIGCEAVMVANGRDAIAEFERAVDDGDSFDAILMDLHMPILDGFEATAGIRRICNEHGVRVPAIIAVTANAFQEDRDRCKDAGMHDYLAKPFEPDDLKQVLARVRSLV